MADPFDSTVPPEKRTGHAGMANAYKAIMFIIAFVAIGCVLPWVTLALLYANGICR